MKKNKTTDRTEKKRRQDTRTDEMKHSTYYHSYFEGYTEARVPADNRRGYKIVRVYTSDYFVLKNGQSAKLKLIYLLLFLAAFIIFVASAIPATSSNMTVYVALPVALSMILLIISGAMLFFYIAAPVKMTIYQHSYSEKLKITTGFAAIALGVSALCTLLSFLLIQDAVTTLSMLCTAGYAVSFFLILMLNRMENKAGYTREHNPNVGPEEGNVIC